MAADRRRAVLTLLNDAEWSRWSDREIARRCGVSPDTVGRLRRSGGEFDRFDDVSWIAQNKIKPSILSESGSIGRVFVHPKTGQPTIMRTANIGRRPSASEEEWGAVREALSDRDGSDSRGAADKWLESGDDDGFDEAGSDFDPQAEMNNILKALGGTRSDPLRLYNQWRMLLMRLKAEGKRTSDYLFGQTEGEINDLILDRIERAYPKVSEEDIEEAAARESQRILTAKAAEEAAYKAVRPYGSFEETLSLFERVGQALATHSDLAPKHEQQVRRICHSIIETGFGVTPRTARKVVTK
ncbi:MAG TPA: helix-turn-helix domain-containing protein [Blastocatellia bacterium]|nr:helix-turn-helix domain-containing protein [Blastocatellia bacterium]